VVLQAFLQWLDKGFPFVSILVAVLLYQYLWGVAVCGWLILCQVTANAILVDAVSRNQPISRQEVRQQHQPHAGQ
jgi:Co/Zn/Cd efflux system component